MADMVQFEKAVDQVILDSKRLHDVVNGGSAETVITEDGSPIPTVRKALLDNLYYKTPPLPWVVGTYSTVFNQIYAFNGVGGVQWWYAPGATESLPIALTTDPSTNPAWRLYNDTSSLDGKFAPINSPIFTGNPQGPTPPANDNSRSLATTAFVVKNVADAIASAIGGTNTNFTNISVSNLAKIATLQVDGDATFKGKVEAPDSTGRFAQLRLTRGDSTLEFETTDGTRMKTVVARNSIQTSSLATELITNGKASSDPTNYSLTGNGNNVFDYVFIRGNGERPVSDPRLKVAGLTELENLRITGTISGVTFTVDGEDIRPNSVTTTAGLTVGSNLVVNGSAKLGATTMDSLEVLNTLLVDGLSTLTGGIKAGATELTSTLKVAGLSTLTGGFATGSGNGSVGGNLTVGGQVDITTDLKVGRDENVGRNLTVVGDATLNSNGTGTTTVHNLNITGVVTGLVVDLSGQNVSVASLAASNNISATNGVTAGGRSVFDSMTVSLVTFAAENFDPADGNAPPAAWNPSGESNVYNLILDKNVTIGPWPDLSSVQNGFSAMIYLHQDATGNHTVTLDASYSLLNDEEIKIDANAVSILQLTYCGIGDVIDVVVVNRK